MSGSCYIKKNHPGGHYMKKFSKTVALCINAKLDRGEDYQKTLEYYYTGQHLLEPPKRFGRMLKLLGWN